ncbi:MAG TPA: non-canonical purine NTP pyrophosphatase, RdgB/HAM1 family [Clostridiales bacterium]|nr:non-canonical purine NTP pyrophosphatase, RdgB/HAM1 family [Clostridiales bacterium]
MDIVAATNNSGKAKEFAEILKDLGITVLTMKDLGISVEIPETGKTFAENAMIKAREVEKLCNLPVLADDSGLCVNALDGAPGLYSARFAGIGATDSELRAKLLKAMEGEKDRSAFFISSVAMLFPDGRSLTAEGRVHGEITESERGNGGFGYDAIFYCPEIGKTFAEAEPYEKDKVSHRARALGELYKKLKGVR